MLSNMNTDLLLQQIGLMQQKNLDINCNRRLQFDCMNEINYENEYINTRNKKPKTNYQEYIILPRLIHVYR